jgi:DNA-binding CsgD family transcriptional regulator
LHPAPCLAKIDLNEGDNRVNQEARDSGLLDQLTVKEREVLDLVLQHKPSKQIARELGLAPNTIDMRLRSAREKLGTTDRNATARAYSMLLAACGKTTCGFSVMDDFPALPLTGARDRKEDATFVLQDAGFFNGQAPWDTRISPIGGLEALGDRFGAWTRIALVIGLAALLAMTVLAVFAIAESLSHVELPGFLTT